MCTLKVHVLIYILMTVTVLLLIVAASYSVNYCH
jgi:hypothetical protein